MHTCQIPSKILIVEDDSTTRNLLEKMLRDCGHIIAASVESGEQAIAAAGEKSVELVLMDIGLKGRIDGIEASTRIRKEHDMPVVYITGGIDDNDFERLKDTVPHGFLIKPLDYNMLISTVDLALHRFSMEKKLQESEERNTDIVAAIPDTLFYVDRNGRFFDEEERKNAGGLWPDKVARKALSLIQQVDNRGGLKSFEYAIRREGKIVYIEARIIASGRDRFLVVIRDISERRAVEQELRDYRENLEKKVEKRTAELSAINRKLTEEISRRKEMEEELIVISRAMEQSPYLGVILTPDGKIDVVNKKCQEMTGYSLEELKGLYVGEPGNPLIPEPEFWQKMKDTEFWKGETYCVSKEGKIIYGNAAVSRIFAEDGSLLRYVVIAEDITEKKREEHKLDQMREVLDQSSIDEVDVEMDWREWQDKMMNRNITRTDKSLFRNINNSFTQGAGFGALISLLEMMESTAEKSDGRYCVDSAVFDLVQKNVTIAQTAFKTFSNIDWIITNDFDLSSVTFQDFHTLCRIVMGEVERYCALKDQRLIINALPGEYGSLKLNLNREFMRKALYEVLLNALKFSRRGTWITLLTSVSGKNINLSVINDPEKGEEGIVGIPPEYERVIFEPFFRLSKLVFEQYHSLDFGLGLTLVEKVVSKHGGEVFAKNILDHSDFKREPLTKVNLSISLPRALDDRNA